MFQSSIVAVTYNFILDPNNLKDYNGSRIDFDTNDRIRKHRPKEDRWEEKYLMAKLFKSNPNSFSDLDSRMIQNWIRNQNKTIMTQEMEKKWFDLGESTGISNKTMIQLWKTDPSHEACVKWAKNKKKQRKNLSEQEKQWLIFNNVLSKDDLVDPLQKKKNRRNSKKQIFDVSKDDLDSWIEKNCENHKKRKFVEIKEEMESLFTTIDTRFHKFREHLLQMASQMEADVLKMQSNQNILISQMRNDILKE